MGKLVTVRGGTNSVPFVARTSGKRQRLRIDILASWECWQSHLRTFFGPTWFYSSVRHAASAKDRQDCKIQQRDHRKIRENPQKQSLQSYRRAVCNVNGSSEDHLRHVLLWTMYCCSTLNLALYYTFVQFLHGCQRLRRSVCMCLSTPEDSFTSAGWFFMQVSTSPTKRLAHVNKTVWPTLSPFGSSQGCFCRFRFPAL